MYILKFYLYKKPFLLKLFDLKKINKKGNKMITKLYCDVDDFCKSFYKEFKKILIPYSKNKRGPKSEMSISEIMTIVILFHISNYRTFKHFYFHVQTYYKKEFPKQNENKEVSQSKIVIRQ